MTAATHLRQPLRRSRDECWPLRRADGRTWAESQRQATEAQPHPSSSPQT